MPGTNPAPARGCGQDRCTGARANGRLLSTAASQSSTCRVRRSKSARLLRACRARSCGVLGGALIGGYSTYQISRRSVKADIKRELADEMHAQLVWLRRKVRESESANRECAAMHNDCERKLLAVQLEIARLRALAPRDSRERNAPG